MQGRRFRFNVTKNIESSYLKEMIRRIYQAVLEPEDIFSVFNDIGILINATFTSFKVGDFNVMDQCISTVPIHDSYLVTGESQCLFNIESEINRLTMSGFYSSDRAFSGFFFTSEENEHGHNILAKFNGIGGVTLSIEFKRQAKQNMFSENTLLFLNYLYPHFVQFFRLSSLFQAKQFEIENDSTSLRYLSRPFWIVDEDLQLIFNNRSSHRLMGWHEYFYCKDGKLCTKDGVQNKRLQGKVRKVSRQYTSSEVGGAEGVFQNSETISLGVELKMENFWIIPAVPNDSSGGLVVIMARKNMPKSEWLEKNFSLTPRQSQLCLLLMQGCSLTATAQHLQISVNTVRNLLAACFRVLDVNNQSELIRLLYSEILVDEV